MSQRQVPSVFSGKRLSFFPGQGTTDSNPMFNRKFLSFAALTDSLTMFL